MVSFVVVLFYVLDHHQAFLYLRKKQARCSKVLTRLLAILYLPAIYVLMGTARFALLLIMFQAADIPYYGVEALCSLEFPFISLL